MIPALLTARLISPVCHVSVPPRASLGANKAPLAVGLYTPVVVAMKLTLFQEAGQWPRGQSRGPLAQQTSLAVSEEPAQNRRYG